MNYFDLDSEILLGRDIFLKCTVTICQKFLLVPCFQYEFLDVELGFNLDEEGFNKLPDDLS